MWYARTDAHHTLLVGPHAALAFKLMTDPYVGQLTFVRVYSGVLKSGDSVYNPIRGKKERIGRILQMHANHREDKEAVFTGDIVAGVGMKHTSTGDTLAEARRVPGLSGTVDLVPDWDVVARRISDEATDDLTRAQFHSVRRLAGELPGEASLPYSHAYFEVRLMALWNVPLT